MTNRTKLASCLAVAASVGTVAEPVPHVNIGNSGMRALLYVPDASAGYYRGTRFDWSGVIGSLRFEGHEYYPQWFQRMDPQVHDFVYEGPNIVAGPGTAITGPVEEFVCEGGQALGFAEAKSGGTFIKIWVGVLCTPDAQAYDMFFGPSEPRSLWSRHPNEHQPGRGIHLENHLRPLHATMI